MLEFPGRVLAVSRITVPFSSAHHHLHLVDVDPDNVELANTNDELASKGDIQALPRQHAHYRTDRPPCRTLSPAGKPLAKKSHYHGLRAPNHETMQLLSTPTTCQKSTETV